MRLFFGVPVNEDVRSRVEALQARLRRCGEKVKWVEPENLHFTLRFVGEVLDRDAEVVARAGEGLAEGSMPVGVRLQGVGAFPSPRRARVVWVKLTQGGDSLARISRGLDARLEAALALPPEPRGFTPHLTIGRVKVPMSGSALGQAIEELREEDLGGFTAEAFMLYHSTLTPQGPVYRVLRRYGV
jgi:2'-5' RNA ligase